MKSKSIVDMTRKELLSDNEMLRSIIEELLIHNLSEEEKGMVLSYIWQYGRMDDIVLEHLRK